MAEQRKLAAILAADIAGFSRLTGADEERTLARLRALRSDVVDPTIALYKGRVVKRTGDGLLVEFRSVVDAVRCAIEVQNAMLERNVGLPPERRIEIRIGIHLGDVVEESDGDLMGDGVNIAARLEGVAQPGAICLSDDAYRQVRSRLNLNINDLGETKLKNIADPMRIFSIHVGNAEQAQPQPTARTDQPARLALPDKPSIAVLPFSNMSGDPEQDYFSDGITEDLISQLSRFRELFVISRSSSFVFKGKAVNIAEIASKLGVQFVAEGSIRKTGGRVRVTVQLIDARHDAHVWAERYDRGLEDIFDVQDEVVSAIAATLVGRLEQAALERAKNRPSGDLRAYEHYLRALKHFVAWTPPDNRKARELLEAAVKADPDYAAAHALLAEAVFRDWFNGWSSDPQRDFTASHETAARSVQLDDEDSRTHAAFGYLSLFHGQQDRARFHLDRAIQLNPSNAHALVLLSGWERLAGNVQAAVDRVREAQRLNPFGKYGLWLGQAHYAARRYDEATAALKNLSNPPFVVKVLLAASQAMSGKDREAIVSHDAVVEAAKTIPGLGELAGPSQWRKFVAERWPYRNEGDLEHLFDGLRKAGLPV